jgi:hypothetical protein
MKISFLDHKRRYKHFFEHPSGMYILHELMDKFYITKPTIRKGDTEQDYLIREGMRQVVLYIMSQTNYDIDTYLKNIEQYKTEVTHDR